MNFVELYIALGFISFILRDPDYYNVKEDKVGPITSEISFQAEIVLIFAELFIGPSFDLFGRKAIVIFG